MMKPTRGRPGLWPRRLPGEQQLALGATAALLLLLSGVVFYQQLRPPSTPTPNDQVSNDPGPGLTLLESLTRGGGTTPGVTSADANQPGTVGPTEVSPGQTGAGSPTDLPNLTEAGLVASPREPLPPDRLTAPLPHTLRVLKSFGSLDQGYGDYRLFDAVALEAAPGQAVLAAAAGRVVAIEEDLIHGRSLLLDHGGGMLTRYAGLGGVFVDPGAQVEAGATIAEVGSPGPIRSALGPHLGFAVTLDQEPSDPFLYLKD